MRRKTNFNLMFGVLVVLIALSTLAVGGVPEVADVAAPEIGDSTSDAELADLQTVATKFGMSLQAAIDRYAWNDNFALTVEKVREATPAAFTGAEIVDAGNAWVAFTGDAPQAALDIIESFRSSHTGVSVEVRTDKGFTALELEKAIEAAHFAVFEATEVRGAYTSFDFATGHIESVVVLESTAPDSALDALRVSAVNSLKNATRADIVNSITVDVVSSDHEVLGSDESGTEHLGGESLSTCTSGFGTITSSQARGISTAGHCGNSQSDDGSSLAYHGQHMGTHGDFQVHSGPDTETDDFYAGSSSAVEADRRDVSAVGAPTVGQTLCRNGKTSYKDCQEVRKLNVCNGSKCNLVQMGSHLSAGGDSGGPVYWGNTAYGLHQGMVYDPWPFSREVFSRADRIDDALGQFIATTD